MEAKEIDEEWVEEEYDMTGSVATKYNLRDRA